MGISLSIKGQAVYFSWKDFCPEVNRFRLKDPKELLSAEVVNAKAHVVCCDRVDFGADANLE
jgi:hypothetical protein